QVMSPQGAPSRRRPSSAPFFTALWYCIDKAGPGGGSLSAIKGLEVRAGPEPRFAGSKHRPDRNRQSCLREFRKGHLRSDIIERYLQRHPQFQLLGIDPNQPHVTSGRPPRAQQPLVCKGRWLPSLSRLLPDLVPTPESFSARTARTVSSPIIIPFF